MDVLNVMGTMINLILTQTYDKNQTIFPYLELWVCSDTTQHYHDYYVSYLYVHIYVPNVVFYSLQAHIISIWIYIYINIY